MGWIHWTLLSIHLSPQETYLVCWRESALWRERERLSSDYNLSPWMQLGLKLAPPLDFPAWEPIMLCFCLSSLELNFSHELLKDFWWKCNSTLRKSCSSFIYLLIKFWKVTFHVQLLQNFHYIPHVVQYVLEPILQAIVYAPASSTPFYPYLFLPTGTTYSLSISVTLLLFCYIH